MTTWIVSSGVTSRFVDLSTGDTLIVENGGAAIGTTVEHDAAVTIQSGGFARGTTIDRGGAQFVTSGGSSLQTTVEGGGFEIVEPGGRGFTTTVVGGGHLVSTGILVDTTSSFHFALHSGGRPDVRTGESEYVLAGGHIVDTRIQGTVQLFDDGSASNTTIRSGGAELVSSGAMSIATQVLSGGSLVIAGGGTVTDSVVSAGAHLLLQSGATLSDSVIEPFSANFQPASILVADTLEANYFFSQEVITDLVVDTAGEQLVGGTADGIVLNDASLSLFGGADATHITIGSGGSIYVEGASAVGVVIDAGGTITAYQGYGVSDLQLQVGGTLQIDEQNGSGLSLTGVSFDQSTDVLTLTGSVPDGQVTRSFQLVGDYSGDQFTLTQGGRGALVTLAAARSLSPFHPVALAPDHLVPADFGWTMHPAAADEPAVSQHLGAVGPHAQPSAEIPFAFLHPNVT